MEVEAAEKEKRKQEGVEEGKGNPHRGALRVKDIVEYLEKWEEWVRCESLWKPFLIQRQSLKFSY